MLGGAQGDYRVGVDLQEGRIRLETRLSLFGHINLFQSDLHLEQGLCLDDFDEKDSDRMRHLELLGRNVVRQDHGYLVWQDQLSCDLKL